jgi:4-hydroxybenzoate polyprenyltransferase
LQNQRQGVSLENRTAAETRPVRAPTSLLAESLRLLRPHHWLKSGFVFAGYFFVKGWQMPGLTETVLLAAGAFALVSSAVYVLNDIADRKWDRLHQRKQLRPLASGAVPLPLALALLACCLAGGLLLGWLVSLPVLELLALYLVLSLLYSAWLKHVVILDVFTLGAGYMLRILVGTVGIGIPPSKWLILCGIMLALFLGFAKRHAEIASTQSNGGRGRAVLTHYSEHILDLMIVMTGGVALATYALYTVDETTVAFHGTEALVYTVPIVTYGFFRYIYLLHHHEVGEDTSREIFTDLHMVATVVIWLAAVLVIFHSA